MEAQGDDERSILMRADPVFAAQGRLLGFVLLFTDLSERRAGTIVEVPGSTTRLGPINLPVAGGGYFRLLPYWWTRWGISRVNRLENRAAVFYLHPWEIDPGQPRLPAGRLGRFRHYRHLEDTESRLRQLLTDFRFGRIAEVVAHARAADQMSELTAPLPYAW